MDKFIKSIFYIIIGFDSLMQLKSLLKIPELINIYSYGLLVYLFMVLFIGGHVLIVLLTTLATYGYIDARYEKILLFHPLTYLNTFNIFLSVLPF